MHTGTTYLTEIGRRVGDIFESDDWANYQTYWSDILIRLSPPCITWQSGIAPDIHVGTCIYGTRKHVPTLHVPLLKALRGQYNQPFIDVSMMYAMYCRRTR